MTTEEEEKKTIYLYMFPLEARDACLFVFSRLEIKRTTSREYTRLE